MPPTKPPAIENAFRQARREERCALVPYLTLGYPSMATSLAVLDAVEGLGVDVVEVGIPFSDPVADGPTIQHTIDHALRQGVHLAGCLQALGERPALVPRLLFSYYNPLLRMGLAEVARRLASASVSGALVTDLVPEEAEPWLEAARAADVETCFLVTPTSTESRLRRAVASTTGFVYCVSTLGVTGARSTVDPRARQTVDRVRALSDLPVAVGFGVSSAEDVRRIRSFADGVVVGSALLRAIGDDDDPEGAVRRARSFLEPLLEACR